MDSIKLLENRVKSLESTSNRLGTRIDTLGFTVGLISDGPVRAGLQALQGGIAGPVGQVAALAASTTLMMANQIVSVQYEGTQIRNESMNLNRLNQLRSQSGLFKTEADMTALSLEAARDRMTTAQASQFADGATSAWDKLTDRIGLTNNSAARALSYKKTIVSKREIMRMMGRTEEQIDKEMGADDAAPVTRADLVNASEKYLSQNWLSSWALGVNQIKDWATGDVTDKVSVARAAIRVQHPNMSDDEANALLDSLAKEQKGIRQLAERESSMKLIDTANQEGSRRATKTLVGMREVFETRKADWLDKQFFVRVEAEHRD